MTTLKSSLPCSLIGMLGQSSLNEEELAELRHRAWWEQGLFIVHPWDRRLSVREAEFVNHLAEKLYGGRQP